MRVGSVVGVMLDEVDVMLEETVQATADSFPGIALRPSSGPAR
jgi:hypothetical protein